MFLALAANPRSGRGAAADVARRLEEHGAVVEHVPLDDLPGAIPVRADRIVVAGGDGSLGPAALAAQRTGKPLAVVPTGTANDFARVHRLPLVLDEACALAADPRAATREHEIGLFDGHPYLNTAAAGLSVDAAGRAARYKRRLGPLAYPLGAVRAGLTGSPLPVLVRCDGEAFFDGDAWQVVVAVSGGFGGGSHVGAGHPDDGLLDVVVVPAGPRATLVRYARDMRLGRLAQRHDVPHRRAHRVRVEPREPAGFNVDGEVRRGGPVTIGLLEDRVTVVVPRASGAEPAGHTPASSPGGR